MGYGFWSTLTLSKIGVTFLTRSPSRMLWKDPSQIIQLWWIYMPWWAQPTWREPTQPRAFMCFGIHGINTFLDQRVGFTRQFKASIPILPLVCIVWRTMVAFEALCQLDIMSQIEDLLKTFLAYFKFSPKKHLEFVRLIELMETKGLKFLKNVKSCWVYTIEPLIQILQEYRVLLIKMKVTMTSRAMPMFLSIVTMYFCLASILPPRLYVVQGAFQLVCYSF